MATIGPIVRSSTVSLVPTDRAAETRLMLQRPEPVDVRLAMLGAQPEVIMHAHAYRRLALNLILSLIIMYFVMFAMIDTASDFFHNLNMVYMALMMVAPMAILMLLLMGPMYPNRKLNLALHAGFAALFLFAFAGIRAQAAIGDVQFLRSMIPHHSGAILMCRKANLGDPEIMALCGQIRDTQRREIEQMNRILKRY